MIRGGLAATTAESIATIAVTAIANLLQRHLRLGPLAMQTRPYARSRDAILAIGAQMIS